MSKGTISFSNFISLSILLTILFNTMMGFESYQLSRNHCPHMLNECEVWGNNKSDIKRNLTVYLELYFCTILSLHIDR